MKNKRVQFARVLTQIWDDECILSRYLFLDEPVAGMDPAHQHEALKIAREFSRREVGVLVVLHDINLAAMYADRIAVFYGGNLYQYGKPEQVLTEALIKEVFGPGRHVAATPDLGLQRGDTVTFSPHIHQQVNDDEK